MSLNEQQILVVDDDPIVLKSLKQLLSVIGYDADTAVGGQEAIVQLGQREYDLVLLDLHMPYVSGHDVLAHISDNHINTAVIVVSGETSFEAARDACSKGAYDFLRKPYGTEELILTIKNALKDKQLQKQNTLMQEQLKESERLYRYLVNTSPDIIYILDPEGNFTFINERIETLLGYEPSELVGMHYSALVMHDDLEKAQYVFNERRIGDRASKNIELRLKCKDDGAQRFFDTRTLPIELSSMGIYKDNQTRKNRYLGTYGVARDITERKIAEETINFQAYHDLLTKLPNRALLKDRLNLAISQAKRDREQLAIMFLDLDRFKNINDTLGHMIGDELLQQVSKRLKGCIREGDTLARFGGDEFTLMLPDVSEDKEDIRKVAGKITEALKDPFNVNDHELYVSASIGISVFPADGTTMDSLIKNADIAMYHVKGRGKNDFQFYSSDMTTPYFKNLSLETGIRKALENKEFKLVYQPQINLQSGEINGVEALLRWDHPTHGSISPTEFIPFAEESGLINELGRWVIQTAMKEMHGWQKAGLPSIRMSINMSSQQLNDDNIVRLVTSTLKKYGLHGSNLEIEITENSIMEDMESVIQKLEAFHRHGITIAIDDFGTGYSSLSYLHKLPIQTLKIDRMFIKDSSFSKGEHSIVNTIIAMGKGLDLNVIAEGVETEVQLNALQELECHEAQGYLFGKPLEAEIIAQLLIQEPQTLPGSTITTNKGHLHH